MTLAQYVVYGCVDKCDPQSALTIGMLLARHHPDIADDIMEFSTSLAGFRKLQAAVVLIAREYDKARASDPTPQ